MTESSNRRVNESEIKIFGGLGFLRIEKEQSRWRIFFNIFYFFILLGSAIIRYRYGIIAGLISSIEFQSNDNFSFVCVLIWNLWNSRNSVLLGGYGKSAVDIIESSRDFLLEFHNQDVSVRSGKEFIGIGAAIRDSSGKVVVAISKPMAGKPSVKLGELLALREGLLLAKRNNLTVNYAEVDASSVASMVNSKIFQL